MWLLFAGSSALAGGTLTVSSVSVDGLELRDLTCTLDKQLLLGPLAIGGALASQKAALDACAPAGGAFRVRFQWTDPPSVSVDAASDPAASACVQKAIGKVSPVASGTCSVVVLTGPKDAAEAARARLK